MPSFTLTKPRWPGFRSLGGRLVVALSVPLLMVILAAWGAIYLHFRPRIVEQVSRQQLGLVDSVALGIEQQLQDATRALEAVALGMPSDQERTPSRVQAYLNQQHALRSLFGYGLVHLDAQGKVVAESPLPPGPSRTGVDLSFRPYFQAARQTKSALVSDPYVSSRTPFHPAILVVVPLLDAGGGFQGILGGQLDLLDTKGFLPRILELKVGSGGYLFLFGHDRTMILHPERNRILQQDVRPGVNRLFDKAIQGWEGAGETVNSQGRTFISAFRKVKGTPWILAANYPAEEAFAPLRRFRAPFLLTLAMATVLLCLVVWQVTAHATKDLKRLTELASREDFDTRELPDLGLGGRDEVAVLSSALLLLRARVHTHTQALETANADLHQALIRADAAHKAKIEFLANLSHDVRTTTNAVLFMVSSLQDPPLGAPQQEYVSTLQQQAQTLFTLLNTILDFSKLEAGQVRLELLNFDLRLTLADLTTQWKLATTAKGLEFDFQIDPEVPSNLRGDPTRIRQILSNLVGNALKFTERGRISVLVQTAPVAEPQVRLAFVVRDTGPGIPPERMESLFQPFDQGEPATTRRHGGLGLGLSLSRQLARMMEGDLVGTSAVGTGSTFTFTATLSRANPFDHPIPEDRMDLQDLRVLVVDDDPLQIRVISQILLGVGCRPTTCQDPFAALPLLLHAVAEGHPFRFALLDLRMPGRTGDELGRALRAQPELADLQLILITADTQPGDAARMEAAGFSAYLSKPLSEADLVDCLRMVAANSMDGGLITRHTLAESRKRRFRILVADDIATNRKVILKILDNLGYTTESAADGAEAVALFRKTPFDLILMDIRMPGMDGYDATRAIRACGPEGARVPIIAVTAHDMKDDREHCLAAGMDDYLTKPIHGAELASAVTRWLEAGAHRES